MHTSLKKFLAGLTLIGLGVAAGWGLSQWRAGSTHAVDGAAPHTGAAAERKVLYWYDPMSPTQKFNKPGKSPFMDMELVPMYADEGEAAGSVKIDPTITQNLGLRLATVTRTTLGQEILATGVLGFNERELAVVQARRASRS